MNRTYCDICGQEMKRQGFEIRTMSAPDRPANRHMCETCFMRLIINGEQRKEDQEDV